MAMRLILARLLLLATGAAQATTTTGGGPPLFAEALVDPTASPDARSSCDEGQLKRDAVAALVAHFDVELGAVAAGNRAHVGFQHLKPADALFAAQALAHDDFSVAAAQFQAVLRFQRPGGLLPHIVYGPSVSHHRVWIPSNRTFHPGPAFWTPPSELLAADAASNGGANASAASNGSNPSAASAPTSTLLAPPIAADVAWQIFRLAPYDAVLGVVSYQTHALQFLCNVFEPLKRLQQFILSTRAQQASGSTDARSGRLVAHHPWETFSSLSPHWKFLLSDLKKAADFDRVVRSIPDEAKERFAAGAIGAGWGREEAVTDMYEPMIYLASTLRARNESLNGSSFDDDDEPASLFAVADVEFNSLVLRSAQGLVNIAHILTDHSSVCTDFSRSREQMVSELASLRSTVRQLQTAIVGNATQTAGFWNATSKFFDDVDSAQPTSVYSMRGVLPAYASELPPATKTSVVEHFFSPASSFDFFCAKFPATFFACSSQERARHSTWMLYNYFAQRALTLNGFPGVAEFVRNKTRDMVCTASSPSPAPVPSTMAAARLLSTSDDVLPSPSAGPPTGARAVLSLIYDSDSGKATPELFDDGYIGSTLAAAAFLNILLPAVTAPPSPDKPPVDHRMLTVIMCVELVVAFGVALSCVVFSVYFVANRPRDSRASPPSPWENGTRSKPSRRRSRGRSGNRRYRDDSEAGDDAGSVGSSWARGSPESPYSDERVSYSSASGQGADRGEDDLEEALLSDDDEHAYGSIEPPPASQTMTSSLWSTVKGGLHAISPW